MRPDLAEEIRLTYMLLEIVRAKRNDLEAELKVTDELLRDRQRVLDAIPPCPVHGPCIPHALAWIERAKAMMENEPCA
jgi:hypothetical protein